MASSRILCTRFWLPFFVVYLALFPLGTSFASNLRESIDISVAVLPMPVPVGGIRELVYEVRVTNFDSDRIRLHKFAVLDGSNNKQLRAWSGRDLAQRLALVEKADDLQNSCMIVLPGQAVSVVQQTRFGQA